MFLVCIQIHFIEYLLGVLCSNADDVKNKLCGCHGDIKNESLLNTK